jgi:PAS domain S-box-containing protein
MANVFRRITGVRLGIAIQVFTTLLILAVGYFVIEGNLKELIQSGRPITPYQLKSALLNVQAEVLLIALVAFVSGLILTITIHKEVQRAARGVEKITRGVMEPDPPGSLSREFLPLNSAIRDLSDSLNRFIQRSVTDAIVLVKQDLSVEALNPTAELLLGYASSEVSGRPLTALFPENRANRHLFDWLESKGDTPVREGPRTGSILTQKGEWIPVRLATFQVLRDGQPLRGIVAGVFDAAEWQRIREEFDRAERLSALGTLVSALAHEIKNPLGAIHGLVQMLADDVPADHASRPYYTTIQEEVHRLDGIMKRLLDLASPAKWESREVVLRTVLEETAHLMEGEAARRGVVLAGEVPAEEGRTLGDPSRIKQAIINVVKNAIEATPEGGRVTWALTEEPPWVVLSVKNPGTPFSEAVASRVPAPFVSTKVGGTGLGLAITHQILQLQGGRLQLENPEEGGAVVRLLFPSAGPAGPRREDSQARQDRKPSTSEGSRETAP